MTARQKLDVLIRRAQEADEIRAELSAVRRELWQAKKMLREARAGRDKWKQRCLGAEWQAGIRPEPRRVA